MLTLYSPEHARHDPQVEMADGKLKPAVEIPSRAEHVLAAVQAAGLGPIEAPEPLDRELVARVHAPDYLAFLETFWSGWCAAGRDPAVRDTFPFVWPAAGLRRMATRHIDGLMGRYSFDAGTPMGAGTWAAAAASASVAQTGARRVAATGEPVFALCRPPGHHAMPDAYGGYCFLNNAAIAAQALRDAGYGRVAVLDVDYHHGNGTQAIFYERRDVLFVSIHADPMDEYPYFLGHADELGAGDGEGATLNLPLPFGTDWPAYREALALAVRTISRASVDALVVSLGLDTFQGDPISRFALQTADFAPLGAMIASVKKPTLFVFEGGYAVEALGANTVGVLSGFLNGR